MNWPHKKLLSWVLMLIMVFSTVQAAASVVQLDHGIKCPMTAMSAAQLIDDHSDTQNTDAGLIKKCNMGHKDKSCQLHPHCTVQINLSTLFDSSPNQLASRMLIRNKLISSDEFVLTIYLSHLKRPPKA